MPRLRMVFGDIIIMVFFLVIGLGGLVYNIAYRENPGYKYARIYVDNRLYNELSLADNDDRSVTVAFGPDNEHEAIVEVNGGRVRMLPLDSELCPRGICSHTGWISRYGESIVCLPNRIMVTFSIPGDNNDIDGITR